MVPRGIWYVISILVLYLFQLVLVSFNYNGGNYFAFKLVRPIELRKGLTLEG